MVLFRPTGANELALVERSGWRAWPPRLPEQAIFYPVLTFEYAEKIARDWNSTQPAPDNVGYVTRFEITREMAEKYPPQMAGGIARQELWVPAEELSEFNEAIVGDITVVAAYRDHARIL